MAADGVGAGAGGARKGAGGTMKRPAPSSESSFLGIGRVPKRVRTGCVVIQQPPVQMAGPAGPLSSIFTVGRVAQAPTAATTTTAAAAAAAAHTAAGFVTATAATTTGAGTAPAPTAAALAPAPGPGPTAAAVVAARFPTPAAMGARARAARIPLVPILVQQPSDTGGCLGPPEDAWVAEEVANILLGLRGAQA